MKTTCTKTLFAGLAASAALAAGSANAATIFNTTNDTTDNAAALDGHTAGSISDLTLSAGDGGGTIELTSVAFGSQPNLVIANGTMGTGNEKWGTGQSWTFSFDQIIDFDGFTFDTSLNNTQFAFSSTAWGSDTTGQSGAGWTFTSNGTTGTFDSNPTVIRVFSILPVPMYPALRLTRP